MFSRIIGETKASYKHNIKIGTMYRFHKSDLYAIPLEIKKYMRYRECDELVRIWLSEYDGQEDTRDFYVDEFETFWSPLD